MKTLATFCLLLAVLNTNAQRSTLIDSVNALIGPDYIYLNDTSGENYNDQLVETDLFGDTTNEIIVVASSVIENDYTCKLFVLAKRKKLWAIVDSSRRYDPDGLALHVQITGSSVTFSYRWGHGAQQAEYTFDASARCFILVSQAFFSAYKNIPDALHSLNLDEEYDVATQTLEINALVNDMENDSAVVNRKKTLHQPLPKGTSLRLSQVKSPEYPFDVFVDKGPVFNKLIKLP